MAEEIVEDTSLIEREWEDMESSKRSVEATLFASETPMTVADIKLYVGEDVDVAGALVSLQTDYEHRGIVLIKTGNRWHFQTAHDLSHLLRRERQELRKLSRAGMETLAIIAYHEPVSRAEIEAIRGVQVAKGTLDVLMEASWVRPAGRREVPGRPLIYATTAEFLTHFGLQSRKDLPGIDDLKAAGLLDPVDLVLERMELEGEEESPDDEDVSESKDPEDIEENGEQDSVLLENEPENA
ncbi:MAG: SMC-Scp complex subunit ScpB [Parasphingorhabdus sp.]